MKKEQLVPLLMKTSYEQGPDPAQFKAAVWHEITHRRALADMDQPSFADTLGGFFRGLAFGGAALAVAIGLTIGVLHNRPARQIETATALKLGVFQPDAGELPHAFLMVRR